MYLYRSWDLKTLIIYCFIAIICAFLLSIATKSKIKKNKFFINTIIFTILIIFSCFRLIINDIGGLDAKAYIQFFLDAEYVKFDLIDIIKLNGKEYIFYNMLYIVRKFTSNYHYLFFIIYSIIIYCYLYFIEKNLSSNKSWPILMLFILPFINSFNIIRNSLATAIGLIAITKYKNKKNIEAIFFCIISYLTHYTGIILFVFMVFNAIFEKKIKKKNKTTYLILGLLSIISLGLVSSIKSFLSNSGYSSYVGLEYSVLGYIPMYILFLLTMLFNEQLIDKLNKDNNVINYNAFLFNLLILPVFLSFNGVTRLNTFFEFSKIIIWIEISNIIKNKITQLKNGSWSFYHFILFFVVISWIIFKIYRIWYGSGIMPYYNELFIIN